MSSRRPNPVLTSQMATFIIKQSTQEKMINALRALKPHEFNELFQWTYAHNNEVARSPNGRMFIQVIRAIQASSQKRRQPREENYSIDIQGGEPVFVDDPDGNVIQHDDDDDELYNYFQSAIGGTDNETEMGPNSHADSRRR